MKKLLIDLPEEIHTELSHMAVDVKMKLKPYIQSVLVTHSGGGFKDKKPFTKRKLKH